jgi:hypothetical protein
MAASWFAEETNAVGASVAEKAAQAFVNWPTANRPSTSLGKGQLRYVVQAIDALSCMLCRIEAFGWAAAARVVVPGGTSRRKRDARPGLRRRNVGVRERRDAGERRTTMACDRHACVAAGVLERTQAAASRLSGGQTLNSGRKVGRDDDARASGSDGRDAA